MNHTLLQKKKTNRELWEVYSCENSELWDAAVVGTVSHNATVLMMRQSYRVVYCWVSERSELRNYDYYYKEDRRDGDVSFQDAGRCRLQISKLPFILWAGGTTLHWNKPVEGVYRSKLIMNKSKGEFRIRDIFIGSTKCQKRMEDGLIVPNMYSNTYRPLYIRGFLFCLASTCY